MHFQCLKIWKFARNLTKNIVYLKFWYFGLKLLFFEIFCRRKISQKIEMKIKREMRKNTKVLCNFHVFTCKIIQVFFHIHKFHTFLNKTYFLFLKFDWKNLWKYAFENKISNFILCFFKDTKCNCLFLSYQRISIVIFED